MNTESVDTTPWIELYDCRGIHSGTVSASVEGDDQGSDTRPARCEITVPAPGVPTAVR